MLFVVLIIVIEIRVKSSILQTPTYDKQIRCKKNTDKNPFDTLTTTFPMRTTQSSQPGSYIKLHQK